MVRSVEDIRYREVRDRDVYIADNRIRGCPRYGELLTSDVRAAVRRVGDLGEPPDGVVGVRGRVVGRVDEVGETPRRAVGQSDPSRS